jgi:hypothetical protein
MEGKGVSGVKMVFVLPILFLSKFAFAQGGVTWAAPYSEVPPWKQDMGLFLEPNHFSIVKEIQDRSLWLIIGYGAQVLAISNKVGIGIEGLAWSRLQMLSGFRFPVETVDYYFGSSIIWGRYNRLWRFRVGHISSHDVDGKDSVFGGSSSKFSREFLEITYASPIEENGRLGWSIAARGYFHQVTKMDPWFSIPATFAYRLISFESKRYGEHGHPFLAVDYPVDFFISTGAGPTWPCLSGGIRVTRSAEKIGLFDTQLSYQYGASWAGTDAGAKRSTINLQMDVRGF